MTPKTAAALNAGPVPARLAAAPTTGPSSAPTTDSPSAVPSSSPRRDSGATSASQASPAAQVHAPAMPCTSRAASSSQTDDDQPNTRVATLIKVSPTRTTRRAPSRATSSPPGSDPARVPAG